MRTQEGMRSWELKSLGVASTFKIIGGTFLIFGLIVGLIASLISPESLTLPIIGIIPSGILGALIFSAFYGFIGGFTSSLLVAIYNLFALLFGGIKIFLEEKK